MKITSTYKEAGRERPLGKAYKDQQYDKRAMLLLRETERLEKERDMALDDIDMVKDSAIKAREAQFKCMQRIMHLIENMEDMRHKLGFAGEPTGMVWNGSAEDFN